MKKDAKVFIQHILESISLTESHSNGKMDGAEGKNRSDAERNEIKHSFLLAPRYSLWVAG
jgi:hypothetical protein